MPQVSGSANWLTNVRQPVPPPRNPLLHCDVSSARLQNERLDRVVAQRLDALHAARHRQLADRTHALKETEKDVRNYRRLQNIIQLNSVAAAIEAGKASNRPKSRDVSPEVSQTQSGLITQNAVVPGYGPVSQDEAVVRPGTRSGATAQHRRVTHDRSITENGSVIPRPITQSGPTVQNGVVTRGRPLTQNGPIIYGPHVSQDGRTRYRAQPETEGNRRRLMPHSSHLTDHLQTFDGKDRKIREIEDLTKQVKAVEGPVDDKRILRRQRKVTIKLHGENEPQAHSTNNTTLISELTRSRTPKSFLRDPHEQRAEEMSKYRALKAKVGKRRFLLVASGPGAASSATNDHPVTNVGGIPAITGSHETSHPPHPYTNTENRPVTHHEQRIRPLTAFKHKENKYDQQAQNRPKSSMQPDKVNHKEKEVPEIRHTSTSRIRALTALPKHRQRRSRREILATVQHHDNPRETVNLPLDQPKVPGRSFQELRTLTHVDHLNDAEKKALQERAMQQRQEMLQQETNQLQEKIQVFYVKLEKFKKEDASGVKERKLTVVTADVCAERGNGTSGATVDVEDEAIDIHAQNEEANVGKSGVSIAKAASNSGTGGVYDGSLNVDTGKGDVRYGMSHVNTGTAVVKAGLPNNSTDTTASGDIAVDVSPRVTANPRETVTNAKARSVRPRTGRSHNKCGDGDINSGVTIDRNGTAVSRDTLDDTKPVLTTARQSTTVADGTAGDVAPEITNATRNSVSARKVSASRTNRSMNRGATPMQQRTVDVTFDMGNDTMKALSNTRKSISTPESDSLCNGDINVNTGGNLGNAAT